MKIEGKILRAVNPKCPHCQVEMYLDSRGLVCIVHGLILKDPVLKGEV